VTPCAATLAAATVKGRIAISDRKTKTNTFFSSNSFPSEFRDKYQVNYRLISYS
jgi:hypothetical protein